MGYDREVLGFVETPEAIALAMLALKHNTGRSLDPAAGMSLFRHWLPDITGLELDPTRTGPGVINTDFFAYPESEQFSTVIGNPPYVRGSRVAPESRALFAPSVLPTGADLYLRFIEKSVKHLAPGGELIFVNPRGFAKDTSARALNTWLAKQGAFTDWVELGDRAFPDASPDCVIWRWQKSLVQGPVRFRPALGAPEELRHCTLRDGAVFITRHEYPRALREFASVKVGAVSGADDIFIGGPVPFVCSETRATGATRGMTWAPPEDPTPPSKLVPHKSALMARRVRHFDETNWWRWGRDCPNTDAPRVYVNCKTRNPAPFFTHPCNKFDGAVLGVFPHRCDTDLEKFVAALNAVDWHDLGFVSSGRFIFTQKSLETSPLPLDFML